MKRHSNMTMVLTLSSLATVMFGGSNVSFAQNFVAYSSALGNGAPSIAIAAPLVRQINNSDLALQAHTRPHNRSHTAVGGQGTAR
jgi:hypothetical protein